MPPDAATPVRPLPPDELPFGVGSGAQVEPFQRATNVAEPPLSGYDVPAAQASVPETASTADSSLSEVTPDSVAVRHAVPSCRYIRLRNSTLRMITRPTAHT